MRDMTQHDRDSLDRHITGDYGEDQFKEGLADGPPPCSKCCRPVPSGEPRCDQCKDSAQVEP